MKTANTILFSLFRQGLENIDPAKEKDSGVLKKVNCENCAQRFSSLDKLENHRKQPCEHLPCEIEHSHESHRLNKTFKTKPEALAYVETKVGDFLVLLENEGIYQCKFAAYGCESKIKILPVEDGKKFLVLGCLFHEQHGGKRKGGMLSQGSPSPGKPLLITVTLQPH